MQKLCFYIFLKTEIIPPYHTTQSILELKCELHFQKNLLICLNCLEKDVIDQTDHLFL